MGLGNTRGALKVGAASLLMIVAGRGSLAVAVLAGLILCLTFVRYSGEDHSDYATYVDAARTVLAGGRLYAKALVWRDTGYAILDPRLTPTDVAPYVYPPFLALVLLPIAALPYTLGRLVWFTIAFGSIVGVGLVLAGFARPRSTPARFGLGLGLAVLIAVSYPSRRVLVFGQVDTLALLLLVVGLAAFAVRRDLVTAIVIGIAIAIKPFLGAIVLLLLWKRAYRAAFLSCVVGGVLVLASFAPLGIAALVDYRAVAVYWSGPAFAASPLNQSPYGVLLRSFTPTAFTTPILDAPMLVPVLRTVVVLLVLGVLAMLVAPTRSVRPTRLALEWGLTLAGMLLVNPLAEDIHLTYLTVALVSVGLSLASVPRPRRVRLALGLGLLGVYGLFLTPSLHEFLRYDVPFLGLCGAASLTALALHTAADPVTGSAYDAPALSGRPSV
ncbi:MAG: DUF2029 domain-containing protein [Chloroflexi bacterium]|nr:DUF2029 domain-containing protein [Chloroflexota bacterium]